MGKFWGLLRPSDGDVVLGTEFGVFKDGKCAIELGAAWKDVKCKNRNGKEEPKVHGIHEKLPLHLRLAFF